MSRESGVTVERVLPHPPEKVWRAVTVPELLADWLMPNDFRAEEGRAFEFRSDVSGPDWDGRVLCEVVEVAAPERLSYRWRTTAGMDTLVTLTLEPVPGGTRLTVVQEGFRATEARNRMGARYGWESFLGRLEALLGRG